MYLLLFPVVVFLFPVRLGLRKICFSSGIQLNALLICDSQPDHSTEGRKVFCFFSLQEVNLLLH